MKKNLREISPEVLFLLVDESQASRDVLSMTLKKLGYRNIMQCVDTLAALQTLKEMDVEFLICERTFRNMSGMEFLKEIRETPEIKRIPFMMTASSVNRDDVILASEFGIDGFLTKPFIMREVSQRITKAITRFDDPANLESHYEEARIHFIKGEYQASIKFLKDILEKRSNARVLTALGRCYRMMDDRDTARDYLERAIKLNRLYVHAYNDLGILELESENTDLALSHFSRAIEISPNNPLRYESVSQILLQRKRYEEAETYLLKAVKLELAFPNLYSLLGKALFAQQKLEKSFTYFQKALKEQPDNPSFLNSMGICMNGLKKYEDAINYYNKALKHNPSDVKVLFNKALALINFKQVDRAIKTLKTVLKHDPSYQKAERKLKALQSPIKEEKKAG